nr:hypothetical protein [Kiritimatiellia bacterium]
WPLQGDSGRTWTVMPNTPVRIGSGATLRADISADEAAGAPVLSDITVSSAGGGTIDGFAFAASGTINVENLPGAASSVYIPMTFTNSTGVANMSSWTIQGDGAEVSNRRLVVRSNGIAVVPIGFSVIIR